MVDSAKIASLHLAVLIGLYRSDVLGSDAWLLLPLGFSVVSVVLFFGSLLNESLRAQHGVPTRAARSTERPSVVRSLLVVPTDYGLLCLVFLLLGAPAVFLWVYGFLFVATGGYLALAAVKWFGEMGRLA
jgi:hypothetical protein